MCKILCKVLPTCSFVSFIVPAPSDNVSLRSTGTRRHLYVRPDTYKLTIIQRRVLHTPQILRQYSFRNLWIDSAQLTAKFLLSGSSIHCQQNVAFFFSIPYRVHVHVQNLHQLSGAEHTLIPHKHDIRSLYNVKSITLKQKPTNKHNITKYIYVNRSGNLKLSNLFQ